LDLVLILVAFGISSLLDAFSLEYLSPWRISSGSLSLFEASLSYETCYVQHFRVTSDVSTGRLSFSALLHLSMSTVDGTSLNYYRVLSQLPSWLPALSFHHPVQTKSLEVSEEPPWAHRRHLKVLLNQFVPFP
jgi:hypothetical protein